MAKHNFSLFLYVVTIAIGIGYGFTWIGSYALGKEQNVVLLTTFNSDRPSVFRVLVPFLARCLIELLRIPPDYSIFIIVVLSFVGAFWALQYLETAFLGNHTYVALFAFAGIVASAILLSAGFGKVYDPATVFFFALSLGFLARNKLSHFYWLFPFATLNRETTFLLTFFFIIYYYRRIPFVNYIKGIVFQISAYILIKLVLSYIFVENPGKPMYFLDYNVLAVYIANPLLTVSITVILMLSLYYVVKNWNEKPVFLRMAFLSIFSAQVLLHFLFGYAYELRVFLESIPVIFTLYLFNIKAAVSST